MARIAISYRREDTGWITGRIFDRLQQHFERRGTADRNVVFMDYDLIPVGADFRNHLRKTLDTCDALLVIIGPRWSGDDHAGSTRIMHATDWVRIEVEAALKKDIPVVPVLIDRTPMPDPDKLPEDIRGLVYRQAAIIDSQIDFNSHVERLIRQLDQVLHLDVTDQAIPPDAPAKGGARPKATARADRPDNAGEPAPRGLSRRGMVYAAAAVLLCALAGGGAWYYVANRDPIGPMFHFTSARLGVSFDFPRQILLIDVTEDKNRKLTLSTMTGERVVTVTRVLRSDKDIKLDRQMERNDLTNNGYLVTLDLPEPVRQANWYVLSGAKDGVIFYTRRWYTADSVISMEFKYPQALLTLFDKVIGPMANKLTYTEATPMVTP